jgi:hypothetical protein
VSVESIATIETLGPNPKRVGWVFTITKAGAILFELDWDNAVDVPRPPVCEQYAALPLRSSRMNGGG